MFVRKKKNRSGSISVVVVSKQSGRYKEIHCIGTSTSPTTIDKYYQQGHFWIKENLGVPDIFIQQEKEKYNQDSIDYFFSSIDNILLNGTQLILNRVFQLIGFDKIEDTVFRQMVISRICHPSSKSASVEYLKSHFNEDVRLYQLYEYLDKLQGSQKDNVTQISVEHTRKILGGKIGLVFYDVTTLYFETDLVDDLRKPGYSKDGKHSSPQIVLGLLVSEGGYPLSYSIHAGNHYEGHTMLPIVEGFVKKFDLKDFVIVADSGLMNNDNISLLEKNGYKYIIGARIKNESEVVKTWILSLEKSDGVFYEYAEEQKNEKTKKRKKSKKTKPKNRLIVGYSEKRSKKDAHNRHKGIKRLEKEYQSGKITKDKINKRGYNKFLEITNEIEVKIDYNKIFEDSKWDGWKGYITNTTLAPKTVYEEYSGLWQIERAFRITKGKLEIRPMFHFSQKRIEAHVCICFVAYKVYKELERILKTCDFKMSVDKVLDIAKTITTIRLRLPHDNKIVERTMLITEKHKSIAILFDENFWEENRLRI